jgi:mRNA-degrading endonuclease RelE of RelBE toxin-antitoxin system
MAKRRERIAPPPRRDGFEIRCYDNDARKGWEELERNRPVQLRDAWDTLERSPAPHPPTHRQHPLRGSLAMVRIDGETFQQWQFEVTSGGRIWYCVDGEKRIVWVTEASVKHPKKTE